VLHARVPRTRGIGADLDTVAVDTKDRLRQSEVTTAVAHLSLRER
jgi:hypothetical protein